jgi:hypothetical protein
MRRNHGGYVFLWILVAIAIWAGVAFVWWYL